MFGVNGSELVGTILGERLGNVRDWDEKEQCLYLSANGRSMNPTDWLKVERHMSWRAALLERRT